MTATYRYFERPHHFSTYQEKPERCDLCGKRAAGYDGGSFSGERDLTFVCEDCLSSGRLQELGAFTNEGELSALRQQLTFLQPALSLEALDTIVNERTEELIRRTPPLVTWQDFFWPAHCGDYCRFVKEVGQPELTALSPTGDGVGFFASHAHDIEGLDHAREVWEGIRPDTPSDGADAYSVGVYLFRCVVCSEPILLWDCD